MNHTYRFCPWLLILILGCWSGCGRSTTVTGPEGEKATVTQDRQGVGITIEGKQGEKVRIAADEAGVALPDGFPKDVPIYPGATITASATTQNMMNVTLQTKDQPQQVRTFYQGTLKQNGWEMQSTMNTPQGVMLQATKAERTQVVTIGRDDDKTTISVVVTEEKK
jgi:hypothetical protein